MASVREIRRRIRSVSNISQVTRAMQMVAASRMRRAQEQALASRAYAAKAWEVLMHLSALVGGAPHPLLAEPAASRTAALVVITGDRGLAGAYNGNVMRVATRFMRESDLDVSTIAVGRKGRDLLLRGGYELLAEFVDLPARPAEADVRCCLKQSLQYTGRSPLGLKGTVVSLPHSAQTTGCISRGPLS